VVSASISPPAKTRKVDDNPIDMDLQKETSDNYDDDEYQESSKMDDSNPDEYEEDEIEMEVANKTKNAQEFFQELEKIKKDTPEGGRNSNADGGSIFNQTGGGFLNRTGNNYTKNSMYKKESIKAA
jgi:hypothetical protein